jgi:hypothetical protein
MIASLGRWLATYLTVERHVHGTSPPTSQILLRRTLRPADVLLIEGNSRVSTAIKYLTQSTWSHAALFIGDHKSLPSGAPRPFALIEADVKEGVRVVDLERYAGFHCRICRPVGLARDDEERLVAHAIGRVGHRYDTKNVIDLMRYLLPTPPVPTRWRRRMITFGSGDPTRAICSTLIAKAFEAIKYPVLPIVTNIPAATNTCPECVDEILSVRHHSLFVPRDFDVSPYFRIIKPTLEVEFDHHLLKWGNGRAA